MIISVEHLCLKDHGIRFLFEKFNNKHKGIWRIITQIPFLLAKVLNKINKKENKNMEVGRFVTNGTDYVVVKLEKGTHVMTETDWKKCYGALHPEIWKK